MARKSMLYIDFTNFQQYAERLEQLGANLKNVFTEALEEAAEQVQEDTLVAMDDANLPAAGKYSQGDTAETVIDDIDAEWHGSVAEIKLGFDKTKPGAGGWLITGTPRMTPNRALEKIYGRKSYERQITKKIEEKLQKEIDRRLKG